MIIKLTPPQVATYWELIKYANIHGDFVSDDHRQQVLNETLHALLNENAQCFIRIDDNDRQIIAVLLTRIQVCKLSGDKLLFIQCIFSFRTVPVNQWVVDWQYLKTFAKSNGCKYIEAESSNPKIFQIMQQLNARELYRTYIYELEDE